MIVSNLRTSAKYRLGLALLSGILAGIAFPPIPTGVTAFVAFIPFLLLLESLRGYGETVRWSYLALFIWHCIVGYWSGGFTHMRDFYLMTGGTAILVFNPFFYVIAVLAFQFVRRYFSLETAVIAFPFLWLSIELFRAHTEFALPWVTLGNTQTYNLPFIQMASITGVYGISFVILLINAGGFIMYKNIRDTIWNIRSNQVYAISGALALLYLVIIGYGYLQLLNTDSLEDEERTIKVALIQPNIDPFEKWQGDQREPLILQLAMTKEIANQKPDLVLWSETAIPFFLLHPRYEYDYKALRRQIDSLGITLLTGVPDVTFYPDTNLAPKSSKVMKDGSRYDSYNCSMLFQPNTDSIQKYAKMLLVPFAERVPYSEQLSFLNAMNWNLGLGGWGLGKEHKIFHFKANEGDTVSFSNLICFESIFPDFVANFVRKGAKFLTITTIDSWWGNTSGAYQHERYAILRAIENRRWVARCATGGISCIIDPFGHILRQTELYSRQTLVGELVLRSDQTIYTRYGDWFAEFCLWIAGAFCVSAIGKKFYITKREQQKETNEIH